MVHPTLRAGALLVLLALASAADAATITVNTTAQSPGAAGDCTLGEAIQAANTNAAVDGCAAGSPEPVADTIVVPAGTYTLTVADPAGNSSGLPSITSTVVIDGASSAGTIVVRPASAPQFHIFYVSSSGNLTVARITISGGDRAVFHAGPVRLNDCVVSENRTGATSDGDRKALTITGCTFSRNNFGVGNAGTLVIDNSVFDSNVGTAISYGASFFAGSTGVTITNTRITNNGHYGVFTGFNKGSSGSMALLIDRSVISGNGYSLPVGSSGGGLSVYGGTVRNSLISGNHATYGGGASVGYCCGANTNGGLLIIENSTITMNSADRDGGGVYRVWGSSGYFRVINSTVSGNTAMFGGGLHGGGAEGSTVVFNHAFGNAQRYGEGGGILGGWITNSIVAGNTTSPATLSMTKSGGPDPVTAGAPLTYTLRVVARNYGVDCAGESVTGFSRSGGYNVIGDGTGCGLTPAAGDRIGTGAAPIDPRIGALAMNGGPMPTHALANDSPAIDAGHPQAPGTGGNSCAATDQRGVARPQGARCDIGAYEGGGGTPVDPGQSMVLTDALPGGVYFESVSTSRGTCTGGQTTVCSFGPMGLGDEAIVTLVVRVKTSGSVTNTAQLRHSNSTTVVGTASATTTVTGTAHTISGRVVDTLGRPSIGTPVTLSGSDTRVTTTDGAGAYTFVVLPGGDYTVTPSRLWHLFAPGSQSYAGLMGDVTADFVATPDTGLLLGAGSFSTEGGWFATRGGADTAFIQERWARLPWPTYNATGGGVHPALGDVDNDGFQEVVLGTGRGGNGWLAVLDDARSGYPLAQWLRVDWPAYNAANGETFPAVGNIDSDPAAEIVVGLGPGGGGWFVLFDDASTGYALIGWRRVNWPEYAANGDGATHPAIANLDGAGSGEIVLGLGQGSEGWVAIIDGAANNYQHRAWVQVPWAEYNTGNGTTWPAAGDVDGDGLGEIVVGLGRGSRGWLAAFDDAGTGFRFTQWIPVAWDSYIASVGETHPAIGNLDGDPAEELVIGFAAFPGEGGWFQVRDDATRSFSSIAWVNLGWEVFRQAGGALFPAMRR